ncbi:uncharacterized protein BCR38DRAFT_411111 [Pseudomassariella vexata]|uniref:Uncharacterized protein n=1 Tax=Pseudomassariella vexata TaxID=1141098 RepID=A0A1Y2DPL3_9PEZI|nr:uncharacterized protein BCR38DRAFT_411111 [Pseudomassariella vexata]ORY61221.1 hypothetical protein BCR38DRAFT_411111 [Pseudomassariella vexata]
MMPYGDMYDMSSCLSTYEGSGVNVKRAHIRTNRRRSQSVLLGDDPFADPLVSRPADEEPQDCRFGALQGTGRRFVVDTAKAGQDACSQMIGLGEMTLGQIGPLGRQPADGCAPGNKTCAGAGASRAVVLGNASSPQGRHLTAAIASAGLPQYAALQHLARLDLGRAGFLAIASRRVCCAGCRKSDGRAQTSNNLVKEPTQGQGPEGGHGQGQRADGYFPRAIPTR